MTRGKFTSMVKGTRNRRKPVRGHGDGPGIPALPDPQITREQWAQYAEQIRQTYLASAEILAGQNQVAFSDMRTRTFWIFTTKDHPAHPAWITRQMVEEDGQVRVRQIGYFAGSEPEFAKLFRFYQERNAQLMEDVARRNR